MWQVILLTVNMRYQLQKVCATWLLECLFQNVNHEKRRKISVLPTLITTLQTLIFNRFCSYKLQLLLIFEDLAAIWNFMNAHWPVWGLLSSPIYSPQSSRIVLIFCSAIILSGTMKSWLWRLYFHFLESFGISKFMYTHRLMFKSGFVTALQLTIFVIKALHKQFVWAFWWQYLSF